MIISVLKEIKKDEGRVAATPSAVRELCAHGHTVLVERDAGLLSGFSNEQYAAAGAELVAYLKQKYGIIERENYNKPKSEDARQPQCPLEKERAITEALKHFGML